MAVTRSFKELGQRRAGSDPAFSEALLRDGQTGVELHVSQGSK